MKLKSPILSTGYFLKDAIDLIEPKIREINPKKVIFQVGTEIHKCPHIGTYITQAMAFVLAQNTQKVFNMDTSVIFKAKPLHL